MKKRNIIMIIMAAAMLLASCGKTPAEETTLYEEPATTSTRSTVVTEPSPTITPVGYVAEVPEEEMYKYLEIFRRTLSGTPGKNLMDAAFIDDNPDNAGKALLNKIRESELKDEDALDIFYDKVIENYSYVGNYLILLIYLIYKAFERWIISIHHIKVCTIPFYSLFPCPYLVYSHCLAYGLISVWVAKYGFSTIYRIVIWAGGVIFVSPVINYYRHMSGT